MTAKSLIDQAADRIVQRICEFDDRTSPEERPDMLLVTGKELCDLITEEFNERLNQPAIDNFAAGLPLEATHQRARWSALHDQMKTPEDWFWTLGYLSGKALQCARAGDRDKALHHCISSAALLSNWHAAISDEAATDGR